MTDQPGVSPQPPSGDAMLPPLRASRLAVASLMCGLVALGFMVLSCEPFVIGNSQLLAVALSGVSGLAGVIVGIWAMLKISRNSPKRKGRGRAIAGICLSTLCLVLSIRHMVTWCLWMSETF